MIRGLYTASSGLVAQTVKQDVIANNIANAQTPGFKRQRVLTASFAQELDSKMSRFPIEASPKYPRENVPSTLTLAQAGLDGSQGPIHSTGNNLDFAIEGPGAFQVISANGTRLTRNGSFRIDIDNQLCTSDGDKVMGENGPITLPKGEWTVKADGSIYADGKLVDTISIAGAVSGKTNVVQGSLEATNVNVVREMVDMITNMRSFEANQKVITSIDSTLDKLINDAGKV